MIIELVKVAEESHWHAYHCIRRYVLYELRGRNGYDDQHPDEYTQGNIPLLLLKDGKPVGTVRLDLERKNRGTVRLAAILPAHQRQGLGRVMMTELEALAVDNDVSRLEVHAAPDAVPFYEKLGWLMVDASRTSPLMAKNAPFSQKS